MLQVISEKNLLTCRTRKRVLDDMEATAAEAEDAQMEKLRAKAVQEVISSEKSYLRHLEIIEEYFMRPLEDSPSILSRKDFVRVFGDLAPILQVLYRLIFWAILWRPTEAGSLRSIEVFFQNP